MAKKKRVVKKKYPIIKEFWKRDKKSLQSSRYYSVSIRARRDGELKTITRQFKDRGGTVSLYLREARFKEKAKKGTKYIVDYERQRIITSPRLIKLRSDMAKEVSKKDGKKKPRIKRVTIKKAPKPIHAKKLHEQLNKSIDYQKEHDITEFLSKQKETNFLSKLLNRATTVKDGGKKLVKIFDKLKNKFAYAVNVKGIDVKTNKEIVVASFIAHGVRPTEIIEALKEAFLAPSDEVVEFGSDSQGVYQPAIQSLEQKGMQSVEIAKQDVIVTGAKIKVSFVNKSKHSWKQYENK